MKSAIAALVSVVLGIALGLLALKAMPPGESSLLGGVLLMVGFCALPLAAAGFAYRAWFHRSGSGCLAGLAAYAALAALVAMAVPDSFPGEVWALLLVVTLVPWSAGFLAGRLLQARAQA
jgi:hypothetical protein